MKVKDLKTKLQNLPDDMEICIFDWRKNLHDDYGDGSGCTSGIYPDFDASISDEDSIPEGAKPWYGLGFKNDDFNDNGEFIAGYE